MIKHIIPKSEFGRNVLTLMTGTTIAQAIPIAISPILTRIYTPEYFGLFALYMSIASIIAVVATGRYELAIMLPKKDEDAINIVALSMIIAVFVSLISFFIVFIFNSQITNLLGNPEISNWLYFIPITVFLTGVYQSLNYWNNRKKQYKRLATSRVVQSGTTATTNLGMGFGGLGASGLIVGNILGQTMATLLLAKLFIFEKNKIKKIKIIAMAKQYIKFPKFSLVAGIINMSSKEVPKLLIASTFGITILGFLSLAQRIIVIPISLLASSMQQVFFQQASIEYNKNKNAKIIYKATFKKLLLIAIIPFLLLFIFAPAIFGFVFGKEWEVSGDIVRILVPFYFIYFIGAPLNVMFAIAEKQKLELYWQSIFFIMSVASIVISSYFTNDIYLVLSSFSAANTFVFLYGIFLTNKIAKGIL